MLNTASRRLAFSWANAPLAKKGLVVVSIPISALLLGLLLVTLALRSERASEDWVAHTLEVRYGLSVLRNDLLDAETAVRGYALSRDDSYLTGYHTAAAEYPRAFHHLSRLLTDNSIQAERLTAVRQLLEQRFEQLDRFAETVRRSTEPLRPADVTALMSAGKAAMGRLRGEIAALDAEEARLLKSRRHQADAARVKSLLSFSLIALMGGLAAVGAVALLSRGIVRRVQALEANAERLARELPPLPVAEADDEIGRLERAIQKASSLLLRRGDELREEANRLSAEVADRRRAETALEAAVRENELVMENSRDVICTIDSAGRFLTVSAASEQVWGYSPDELTGRAYVDLVAPEDRPKTARAAEQIMAGQSVLAFENSYIRKDGSKAPVVWSANWSEKNRVMYCVAHDATEKVRVEHAMAQARDAADRASRAKSDFLSRMSHELRTPMNAILGFAQLLEMQDNLGPEERDSVDQILRGGRHLLGLINEVLDIAKIEAGRMTISPEPVPVGDVLEEVIELVRPLARDFDVQLEPLPALEQPWHVLADRQRLKQVLLNLFSNGIKYNRAGGQVRTTVTGTAGRVCIAVTDSGAGISPENLARLFSPFERLGAEQSRVEGTGLGLTLSQRMAEMMNGSLWVESEPGRGSTFFVELPETAAPAEPALIQPAGEPQASLADSAAVLYIEDNLANLRLVERVLAMRTRFKVLAAMQGRMGLELAREHLPELILLDLHLPDIEGEDLLVRLRRDERTARIPVIVISADATASRIERLKQLGAQAYLTKPLDVKEFLQVLEKTMTPADETHD